MNYDPVNATQNYQLLDKKQLIASIRSGTPLE
jgi:hypothetical protein